MSKRANKKEPKRAVLSVSQKKIICAFKEQKPAYSQQNLSEYFSQLWGKHISRRCVGDILKKKEKWFNVATSRENVKRLNVSKHEKLEHALAHWIQKTTTNNEEITDEIIKDQAKVLGRVMGITDILYSNGWLHRFKLLHGLSRKPGECGTKKVTAKEAQMCIDKIWCFLEQNSDDNDVTKHLVALENAIKNYS